MVETVSAGDKAGGARWQRDLNEAASSESLPLSDVIIKPPEKRASVGGGGGGGGGGRRERQSGGKRRRRRNKLACKCDGTWLQLEGDFQKGQ